MLLRVPAILESLTKIVRRQHPIVQDPYHT